MENNQVKYTYNICGSAVAVFIPGETPEKNECRLLEKSDPNFSKVVQLCLSEDWDQLEEVLGIKFKKEVEYQGFQVKDNVVYVDGEDLPSYLGRRLKEHADAGQDYKPILAFWHKLKLNPSANSIEQLFQFLENNHCPLTPDGNFVGYKAITVDWKDKHTRKIDNSIGEEPSMPRKNVDEDHSTDCSSGYHIGSFVYARDFGYGDDRLVECEVNPEHVVSVANESGFNKLRVCKYKVIKEIPRVGDTPPNQIYKIDDGDDGDDDDGEDDVCDECLCYDCICDEEDEVCQNCGWDLDNCDCCNCCGDSCCGGRCE